MKSEYDQPAETPTEETGETYQTPSEETQEVSQDFKDQVDALLSGITPEQKAYVQSCLDGGEAETEEFDLEGMPE